MISDLNKSEKGVLSSMIIKLLDSWEVDSADKIKLLSLPDNTPTRSIRKYRNCTPFPENDVLLEKIEHLIGIADALRTTYPRNMHMGPQWMNKPHQPSYKYSH